MRKHTYGIDQRSFLHYMATASAIPAIAQRVEVQVTTSPRFGDNPFTLGVASGDPEPDSVVIWNRLAFKPADGGGMVNEPISVQWEVATDEAFGNVVQKGSSPAMPQPGHSVHVEVDGLQPHRWYYYRFHAGDEVSPVGRTRTAPAFDAMPDRLKFAFTSCQHDETGYSNGYPHMQKDDLDLVVHLGDYIYEYKRVDNRARKHLGNEIVSSWSFIRSQSHSKSTATVQRKLFRSCDSLDQVNEALSRAALSWSPTRTPRSPNSPKSWCNTCHSSELDPSVSSCRPNERIVPRLSPKAHRVSTSSPGSSIAARLLTPAP